MTTQCRVNGTYFIIGVLVMEETRSNIILQRIVMELRKETGDDRYRVRGDESKQKLSSMIKTSFTRPISESFDNCCAK